MSPTREQIVDRSVGAIAPSWKIAGRGRMTTRPVFRPRPPPLKSTRMKPVGRRRALIRVLCVVG